ncbi:MAG: rod shape-determining protein MreC [Rhodobacterales bacterium]|nr:rod shape-determining protein MreC [Rhodobacterales bacterium]
MTESPRPFHRITAPVRTLAHRFAFAGLILAAFGLMILGKADVVLVERFRAQVTDAVAPAIEVLSQPVTAMSDAIIRVQDLMALREENARLRADRDRLMHWQIVARKLETENDALRELLQYVPGPDAAYISARVIADTGGAFAHSVILNAGVVDRVRKGLAVVTGAGLVGRVAGVGSRSSRILLITDLNSRIPVLVESSRTRAILAGDNSDRPNLIHLPPGAVVSPGDRVVTSGHGGAFPPGLPVGRVVSVTDGGIKVQPLVSRDRLDYVRVVDYGLDGILRPVAAGAPAPVAAPTPEEMRLAPGAEGELLPVPEEEGGDAAAAATKAPGTSPGGTATQ